MPAPQEPTGYFQVSLKFDDGTIIVSNRPDYAEVIKDIDSACGSDAAERLKSIMQDAWLAPEAVVVKFPGPDVESYEDVDVPLAENEGSFKTCPACGASKNRWVAPGVSKKTGRPYSGFYGCPTKNCPGK